MSDELKNKRTAVKGMIESRSKITRQLFRILDALDWNQEMVANKIVISRQGLSHWRRGQTIPRIDQLEKFADLLGYELLLNPMTDEVKERDIALDEGSI